jgi:hypothetical protein
MLYCSVVWGRVAPQWYLVGHCSNIAESMAGRIFDNEQQQVLDTQREWPGYTKFDKDIHLQPDGMWKEFFDNQQIVMLDMTNINICQSLCAESARLTYSQYYNSNCGKVGIFLQPSSWIGAHNLLMGAVSSSDCLT